jgi:hypothetical protein
MIITPRIGEQVGDVMEADIPGCYHLITGKLPRSSGDGYTTVFDFYPTWRMVDGELVPMSEEEAQRAFAERPDAEYTEDDDEHDD